MYTLKYNKWQPYVLESLKGRVVGPCVQWHLLEVDLLWRPSNAFEDWSPNNAYGIYNQRLSSPLVNFAHNFCLETSNHNWIFKVNAFLIYNISLVRDSYEKNSFVVCKWGLNPCYAFLNFAYNFGLETSNHTRLVNVKANLIFYVFLIQEGLKKNCLLYENKIWGSWYDIYYVFLLWVAKLWSNFVWSYSIFFVVWLLWTLL